MTQEQLAQTPAIALAIWADIPDAKEGAAVITEAFGCKLSLA